MSRSAGRSTDRIEYRCDANINSALRTKNPAMVSGTIVSSLKDWQGWHGSNLRPSVLETDALPTELHPYRRLSIADRFAFVTPSRRIFPTSFPADNAA